MKKHLLLIFIVCQFFCGSLYAERLYVNGSVTASGDGTSWSTAVKTVEEAIAMTPAGGEIWIAQGTYSTPMSLDNLTRLPYNLTKSLSFYGGFVGSEANLSERAQEGSETVITSSFNQILYNTFEINASSQTFVFDRLNFTDSRRVLYSVTDQKSNHYTLNQIIVDGVKCEPTDKGIIHVDEGSQVVFDINNSTFSNNEGSLLIANSKNVESGTFVLNITDCDFTNNPKPFLYIIGVDNVKVNRCHFSNQGLQSSTSGFNANAFHVQKALGVELKNCTFESLASKNYPFTFYTIKLIEIESCRFINNTIDNTISAGAFFVFNETAEANLTNTLFAENNLGEVPYLISFNSMASTVRQINIDMCTFSNNTFAGICNVQRGMIVGPDNLSIRNSIIWNNSSVAAKPIGEKSTVTVSHSVIQNEFQQYVDVATNNTNIFADPQLTPTYTLACSSPAINTGVNPIDFNGLNDLAGNIRVQDGRVDIGAYESNVPYCGGTPTSIDDTETPNAEHLRISNPVVDKCSIVCDNMTRVQVFKTDGSVLKDLLVDSFEVTLDFQDEASGLYIIKVYNNIGEVKSGKVIKQ